MFVDRDGLYYITQDFLRSLDFVPAEEARQQVKNIITRLRRGGSQPPLLFQDDINAYADSMALRRAKSIPQPPIPEAFGQTHILLVTVPSLDMLSPRIKDVTADIYERAAVGVWFGRTEDQPGGAYVITTILFTKDLHEDLSREDLANVVLEELNRIRKRHNLKGLKLNKSLSRDAWRISLAGRSSSSQSTTLPARLLEYSVVTCATEDPSRLPENFILRASRIRRGKIGIGVCSTDDEAQERLYVITIIY